MTTRFIDLTEDSSGDENAFPGIRQTVFKSKTPSRCKCKPARAPLQPVMNNVPSLSEYIPKTDINPALVKAINVATIERLREMLKMICYENVESRKLVEAQFLVPIAKIPLYHADTASEEDNESIPSSVERSSESGSDSGDENEDRGEEKPTRREQEKEREALNKLVNDNQFPVCVNCGKSFNPDTNKEGICIWHEGKFTPAHKLGSWTFL